MKYLGHIITFGVSVATAVGISVASAERLGASESGVQARVDQSAVCVAMSDEQALSCPAGKLFMASLSQQEGELNTLQLEQRLLNTMALYCDTHYAIEQTKAGVLCVLTHERIHVSQIEETVGEASE